MDDYRNSSTIKFCADLVPAHRCPSVLKPLDDPTRLLLRCSRWSLGHRSSDVKSSTARISSHLSNRALLCLQPASAVVCLRHTLRFANSKQRMNKISPKPCHKKCRSTNLRVCKSASLQVCSLRLSHTGNSVLKELHREEPGARVWPKLMLKLPPKIAIFQNFTLFTCLPAYRKIPKISPSMYKPPKLVTQKTLR